MKGIKKKTKRETYVPGSLLAPWAVASVSGTCAGNRNWRPETCAGNIGRLLPSDRFGREDSRVICYQCWGLSRPLRGPRTTQATHQSVTRGPVCEHGQRRVAGEADFFFFFTFIGCCLFFWAKSSRSWASRYVRILGYLFLKKVCQAIWIRDPHVHIDIHLSRLFYILYS